MTDHMMGISRHKVNLKKKRLQLIFVFMFTNVIN